MANILVVDDLEYIRDVLSSVLTENEHHVSEAASGEEALSLMQENIFDIAIVDFRMGELSGLDFLKVVKDISPDTEIIMLTGHATIDIAVEAVRLGAYDFATKPINLNELMLLVNRALEKMELVGRVKALRTQVKERYKFPDIIGNTPAMLDVYALMEKTCQFDSAVLISGESGTGKDLVAQAIHTHGLRYGKPFVPVNCAALPESIQESELFGHMKGAFTNAISNKEGLFESAHGGTLFLDEIADASPTTQAKLLRFLAEGEIRRVGSNTAIHVNVRLVTATNKDLSQAVEEGTFREDLYYRINVIGIHLPSLKERRDDIPLLAQHFLKKYSQKRGDSALRISPETLSLLMQYDWPGNVRELQNAIQHAIAFTRDDTILPSTLPPHVQAGNDTSIPRAESDHLSLYEVEKAYILQVLEEHSWDRARAATALGIGRATIYRKLKEYDFVCPPDPS